MTAEQIELLRASFSKIRPMLEETGVLFYARLFEMDPGLRHLFHIDILEQGHKLTQILGFAVDNLDRTDDIVPMLQEMGARHVQYGVKDEHYDTVASALLWTLGKALKEEYTPEINEAWVALYSFLATAMKSGAEAGRAGTGAGR